MKTRIDSSLSSIRSISTALLVALLATACSTDLSNAEKVAAESGAGAEAVQPEGDSASGSEASDPVGEAPDALDFESEVLRNEPPTGPEDPWLPFYSSELTAASLDLEVIESLSSALVYVKSHTLEGWYTSPEGDENIDVPGRSAPTYLRIRADVEIVGGSLPVINDDRSIFIDLFVPSAGSDRSALALPPAGYLAFVTPTEYLAQEWDLLAEVAGKEAAEEHRLVREQGYVVTTRAGLLVANGAGLRAPLLESDLLFSTPYSFVETVDRGFVLEESDSHEDHEEEALPSVVLELERVSINEVVESASTRPITTPEMLRETISNYRGG